MKRYIRVDDNNTIISSWSYSRYRSGIEIDTNEKIIIGITKYDPSTNSIYNENNLIKKHEVKKNSIRVINGAKKELQEIENWFKSTDWIPNKIIVGEWDVDDKRFLDYKLERVKYRLKQDELKEIINNNKLLN